jgi:alkylresorcinol/alkylpyrone synthase
LKIAAIGQAFPEHYYDQEELISAFKKHWAGRHHNLDRLEDLHRHVLVGGRHLARPLEDYDKLQTFTDSNRVFIDVAKELGAKAILEGLDRAGLDPNDVDHLFFVTTTGIATPSIDALLMNRLKLRTNVKRSPLFGLGCLAGAAGVARAADTLRSFPDQVAVVLSVELCSLTLQREDLSIPNIIASGLFGDGAAAAVLVGDHRPAHGPRILSSRSFFYPDTEDVMGWNITKEGFGVVLSADVPKVAREHIAANVNGVWTGRQDDWDRNIAAVREAARNADIVIYYQHFQIDVDEFDGLADGEATVDGHIRVDDVAQWQTYFARAVIDAGASMYIGHGHRGFDGVEIYRGRPLLRQLGGLAYQGLNPNIGDYDQYRPWSGLLARMTIAGEAVQSIEFIPLELDEGAAYRDQYDDVEFLTRRGLAEVATGDKAVETLELLRQLSREYGTEVEIRGGRAFVELEGAG